MKYERTKTEPSILIPTRWKKEELKLLDKIVKKRKAKDSLVTRSSHIRERSLAE